MAVSRRSGRRQDDGDAAATASPPECDGTEWRSLAGALRRCGGPGRSMYHPDL